METVRCDVFVLGAGGAGLRAAVEAAEQGCSVAVGTKSLPGKSHTAMAEGGMGAALGNADPADSWQAHFRDTFEEGLEINDPRAVEILVKEAPGAVRELEEWGCLFDRDGDGWIRQRAFGGHSHDRACHFGDKTGLELVRTLQYRAMNGGAELLDEVFFLDLLTRGGAVTGAVGVDMRRGRGVVVECGAVVLATGGLGQVFEVTSNSWESTGDGYAMALRAGAELRDMEMIQFHPTGMVHPEGVKGKLVTEAVRGEGGVLLNVEGERFMERYAPEWMELAPRDVVSRAVYREVEAGRGTERGGVYLDATVLEPEDVREKLPGMVKQFEEFAGVDITEERMEVAPTAHYAMGGVAVDPETGATGVEGLFAVGEVAGGVHGANRLGTNSLADIVVFGRRVGEAAAKRAKDGGAGSVEGEAAEEVLERHAAPLERGEGPGPYELVEELREVMWREVGIVRSREGLERGLRGIVDLRERFGEVAVPGGLRYNLAWVDAVCLGNMLDVCEAVVRSALLREESRGAHQREGFPETREEWRANVYVRSGEDGMEVRREPAPVLPDRLREALEAVSDE